jgi:hypothetical protein
LTSIATAITLSQSVYTYPPFSYTYQSNNQPPNITGIVVPFLPIEVVAVVAEAGALDAGFCGTSPFLYKWR